MADVTPSPPSVAPWNLGLRFLLELAALFGVGAGAWAVTTGWVRWPAVILAPMVGATLWGVFNVRDDPSRSGMAPVEVPGAVRLLIEVGVFVAGWWGAMRAGWTAFALVYGVGLLVHHAAALPRIGWLIKA